MGIGLWAGIHTKSVDIFIADDAHDTRLAFGIQALQIRPSLPNRPGNLPLGSLQYYLFSAKVVLLQIRSHFAEIAFIQNQFAERGMVRSRIHGSLIGKLLARTKPYADAFYAVRLKNLQHVSGTAYRRIDGQRDILPSLRHIAQRCVVKNDRRINPRIFRTALANEARGHFFTFLA